MTFSVSAALLLGVLVFALLRKDVCVVLGFYLPSTLIAPNQTFVGGFTSGLKF